MSLRILSSCCFRQASMTAFKIKLRPCNIRLITSIPASRALVDISPIQTAGINLQLCRYKSKKSKKGSKVQEDEDDDNKGEEDGDDGDEDGALPGEKERILKVGVARTDKVLKLATNSARIVEEAFLEGRIYKNETKLLKKSVPIQEGDILDVELGPDPKNPDFIKVHRVEIREIKEGVHSHVKILYSKNLTIKRHSS
ncbi:uncharacterized protein LOC117650301 [Thrips palmi]|uniref:Uncharacterized protein LOC117650301 n=1 Tax=Thrips palmi TaxID=161013 RepID=A0A6P8ZWJ5_THRPL|nr:uncharacterized protein LOC117650301 [Thrips palmi]